MAALGKKGPVLITGIDGFTGRHLARVLSADGWHVAGLGGGGGYESCKINQYLSVDLNDTATIANWLSQVQPTHIIHLAALSFVVSNDPLLFYRVNVLGTESLLHAIEQSNLHLEKIIVASSANIYGNAVTSPINENALPQPQNHYALSKLVMEHLVRRWFDRLPMIITRPFNYTGPGQSERFVFAKIVGAFRRREPEIKLGNLDVARDLSDVTYVTEIYHRLLCSHVRSETFNICSGHSVSLQEVIDLMSDIAGYTPRITIDPSLIRRDDVRALWGDPSHLHHAIGEITMPSLKETLLSMYQQPKDAAQASSLINI